MQLLSDFFDIVYRVRCCVSGADINKQARDGATPLYEACKNDHLCTVEILLSHKADVNLPTKSGLLPIHQATQRANKQ